MVYEFAHLVKEKMRFVWDGVEWMNGWLFGLIYRKELKSLPDIIENKSSDELVVRMATKEDVEMMVRFFAEQPKDAFRYFKPHGFDHNSIKKIVSNKAWIVLVAETSEFMRDNDRMVGYCFMRSFVNGVAYKGYMVDYRKRGLGISKVMGWAMNDIADILHLKMYKSISPDNVASMAATKAVNDVKVIKTLDNGDVLVECTRKKNEKGVNYDR